MGALEIIQNFLGMKPTDVKSFLLTFYQCFVSLRQKMVVDLLHEYTGKNNKSEKVGCPLWLWCWYLFCPAIVYGAALLLCQVRRVF